MFKNIKKFISNERQDIIIKRGEIVKKLDSYTQFEQRICDRDERELRFMIDELIEALHRLQDLELQASSVVA